MKVRELEQLLRDYPCKDAEICLTMNFINIDDEEHDIEVNDPQIGIIDFDVPHAHPDWCGIFIYINDAQQTKGL